METEERQMIQSQSFYYLQHPNERPLIGKHSWRDMDRKVKHAAKMLNMTEDNARKWIQERL